MEEKARLVRRHVIEELFASQSGHPGGSLSCVDILVVLYFHWMRIEPENPYWEDRDRFVLSKGHAAPALYGTLAERGYFSTGVLPTLRQINSILHGRSARRMVLI
jgi:transketolase